MFRTLVATAALGLAAATVTLTATPAMAVNHCISVDIRCQGHRCTNGDPIVNEGFFDTGPWVVICP